MIWCIGCSPRSFGSRRPPPGTGGGGGGGSTPNDPVDLEPLKTEIAELQAWKTQHELEYNELSDWFFVLYGMVVEDRDLNWQRYEGLREGYHELFTGLSETNQNAYWLQQRVSILETYHTITGD